MKYFNKIKSFAELKESYRSLIKANHPDNGGNAETMKEINVEFEAAFRIWKTRDAAKLTEEEQTETAATVTRRFYTANGWAGSNYNSRLTLKEIAAIVRAYVKEKYPTCKFSVRTSYASMCQELHVAIKEFPAQMWKTGEDLRRDGLTEHIVTTIDFGADAGKTYEYDKYKQEINDLMRKMSTNGYFNRDSWTEDDFISDYDAMLTKTTNYGFFAVPTEYFKSVVDDVDALVKSYNYEDCDGMIDYFNVNFYYFGCKMDECKQVEKVARIAKQTTTPTTTKDTGSTTPAIETSGEHYAIEESKHTKTGAQIWLVKWLDRLSREEYITLNNKIKNIGGYYSRYTHSFIFNSDPTEALKAI